MAFNVSALADFNNEVAGKIVLDTVYKGNTAEYVSIQEGIKYQEPINLVSVTPYAQGGDSVTSFTGSVDFTQRNITVTKRTFLDSMNLQSLTSKYLGISALPEGSYEETFALLNDVTSDLVRKVQQDNDNFIWNAISGSAYSAGLTPIGDGLLQIISGSTSGVNIPSGTGANVITGSTAYTQLTDMLASENANVLDAEDLTFFMGTSVFQRVISGLTTQNLFHFDPTTVERRGGFYEVPLPGYPNVKIVGTWGLRDSERVVLGPSSDAFVGTDLTSDTNNFQLWYDINTDTLRYRLRNKLGMQVAHPEYWVSNDQA
jgi:hypothetical protein